MGRVTFCPKCSHLVKIDKYGFMVCGNCGKHFVVKKERGWLNE